MLNDVLIGKSFTSLWACTDLYKLLREDTNEKQLPKYAIIRGHGELKGSSKASHVICKELLQVMPVNFATDVRTLEMGLAVRSLQLRKAGDTSSQ